ncbi:NAD(P)H-binding protein [Actinosynnema sp. NPDC050436]|uniref:NAD(P)-dependent oxidoreductase n=1 Tax=Actinosynnema sp. NPDC050436 TaxID=3155659 RepID=UPI0033D8BA95
MKITVFGSSGGTGIQVVTRARAAGHDVTAVVRRPNGKDAVADVGDVESIGSVIAGADVVVSAIGSRGRGPTTVQTDSAENIVAAMGARGVRRLVVVSNSGMVVDDQDTLPSRYLVKPILRRVLKGPWEDMAEMERVIRASGLEWTIVRPPRLTDGPHTGRYRTAVDKNLRRGDTISRADLADLIVACAENPATAGQAIAVGY